MRVIHFVHDRQEHPSERLHALETGGFLVEPMSDGASCLAAIATERPAAVLLDVLLDGPNGFEVCAEIRAVDPTLPIVLCSRIYRARAFRDLARAAGASRYLLAPTRPEALLEAVTAAIAEADAAPATRAG